MMHLVRLTFLILSLGAAGVVWAYGAHPEWVGRMDRWFCERHLEATQELSDRVQNIESGDASTGLHSEVVQHLQDLGDVQFGERRFELWRQLVLWYVGEARKWGEVDVAITWQAALMAATPRDMEQRLIWIELLMEKARPKDLGQARKFLASMRLGLPEWKPALEMDLRLSCDENDWSRLAETLEQWQSMGGESLAEGWQWFVRSAGSHKWQTSPRMSALPAEGATHYVLTWTLTGEKLQALRVDPPAGSAGILEQVQFVGLDAHGQAIELTLIDAQDCAWVPAEKRLHLSGLSDPRMTLGVPPQELSAIQVHFAPKQAIPDWILEQAAKHSELAAQLADKRLGKITGEDSR
ncbi:MAG: hypothetical protein ACI87O_000064 [Planctomycetota bacterium]|jgi:hypothetical protein